MSRESILAALRQSEPPDPGLPEIEGRWQHFDDRATRFAAALEGAGGRCIRVPARPRIAAELQGLEAFRQARRRASVVDGLGDPNVSLGDLDDPRRLADVGFALLPGSLAVAESGAVWVDASDYLHRAVLFLPEHLGLVVRVPDLVDTLHQAYERIRFEGVGFGCFLAGPSKTADIEQALVIGAHGARSVTVFLVGRS
ncbi:MAG: LUD domain-containing protein [Myxococcota bacterium]|jgi:L-lactate dehydrogenase complex protein LldG